MNVRTAGGEMHYKQSGEGPDVILLHGIPTHSYLWRNVAVRLKGFRTLLVDFIGYGDSEKPENVDLSLSAQASYVKELMDELGIRKAHIVGHDIGGGVAQVMTVNYPDSVKSMVLVDSAGLDFWPVPHIARLKDPAWDRLIEKIDLTDGLRRGLLMGVVNKANITDDVVREYERPFRGVEGRRAYLRAARALDFRDTMKVAGQLRNVSPPTLIVWGAQDEYLPPERGRKLSQTIKNSKLIILENVGHFSPEDAPEFLATVIRGFLEAVEEQ